MTQHDDDDNTEDKIYNENEGAVGFVSPDLFDEQELIELSLEDHGIEVEHEAYDEVKQLKKDYTGKSSKILNLYSHLLIF